MPLLNRWVELPKYRLAAIDFNAIDRNSLLVSIAQFNPEQKPIFFFNCAYTSLQKVDIETENQICHLSTTDYVIDKNAIATCNEIVESSIFVLEGLGEINDKINFELRNLFFKPQNKIEHQFILVDESIEIPLDLYPMILKLRYGIPDLEDIDRLIANHQNLKPSVSLSQACFGLPTGEIKMLLGNYDSEGLVENIVEYKTHKLARRGLRVVPKPDVSNIGGLDLLERDLEKIATLFSLEARGRNLRPPKGCCLWGLPGTGKSLVSKMMSTKLNATLIACEWNDLLDSNLSKSLAKLQYILDVVDNVGNCVLFFDEFEKAFAGWDSGSNGGILAKMAGKLLTWMQDHESPAIMLATINHLDMLPPELIRRFGYIWFFPSEMHNGAMWEVFQLHLQKHFAGFCDKFSDSQWRTLFSNYRGCSPAEIAAAVERTHHEIFFLGLHHQLNVDILLSELAKERKKFKPASTNKTTSNALAKILMEAEFARPVRGEDKSKFATSPRKLFEKKTERKMYGHDEYVSLYYELVGTDKNRDYSFLL